MKKIHLISLGIGLGVSIIMLFLSMKTILLDGAEKKFYDFRFTMRESEDYENYNNNRYTSKFVTNRVFSQGEMVSQVEHKQKLVVVKIDDETLDAFGEWPFPRDVHASFLKAANKANPAGVFFDVAFIVPERVPESFKIRTKESNPSLYKTVEDMYKDMDSRFAREIEKAGNVYIDLLLLDAKQHNQTAEVLERKKEMWKILDRHMLPFGKGGATPVKLYPDFQPLLLSYMKAAKGSGPVNLSVDERDSVVRKFPLIYPMANSNYLLGNITLMLLDYYNIQPSEYEERVKVRLGKFLYLQTEDKVVKIPIDKEGRILINYSGRESLYHMGEQKVVTSSGITTVPVTNLIHGVTSVSYKDVVSEEPSVLSKLSNKYLFIGAFSLGMADDVHLSPYGKMYGITHMANAFNTMYTEQYITESPTSIEIIVIIAIGLLLSLILAFTDIRIASIATIAGVLAFFLVSLWLFFEKNYALTSVSPMLTIALVFVAITVFKVVNEQRDKMLIKNSFSKYVSADVVEELLKDPNAAQQLGGQKKEVSIFFSDVASFTTISEQLGDPQKLVELLNEYLGTMTEIIIEEKGTLDKYIGDAIMAFWGAPVDRPDHPILACRSACRQLNFLWKVIQPKLIVEGKTGLAVVSIRCGLNTAEVSVGNTGCARRMDYTLLGDGVNLAARLEGAGKQYGVNCLISEFTYEKVKNQVYARFIDLIKVKGKTKPVAIYELLGLKGEEESTFYFKDDETEAWEKLARAAGDAGEKVPVLPTTIEERVKKGMEVYNLEWHMKEDESQNAS